MKEVMISVRPQWCELIARGAKTIEVRKTRPKLGTPFRCYIYCTNTLPLLVWGDVFRGDWITEFTRLSGYNRVDAEKIWDIFNGNVIGEFVCDKVVDIQSRGTNNNYDYCYESLNVFGNDDIETEIITIEASCVPKEELNEYAKGTNRIFGWHISNLVIYDMPKELGAFGMKKPPQSWCYVEHKAKEMEGNNGTD